MKACKGPGGWGGGGLPYHITGNYTLCGPCFSKTAMISDDETSTAVIAMHNRLQEKAYWMR